MRLPVLDRRRSGVLLHPTALRHERGALGAAGRAFVDWLADAGFSVWQVLPLGPTGAPAGVEGSPYWARSDYAGNTALIDPQERPDPQTEGDDLRAFIAREAWWLEDYVLFEAISAEQGGKPWWEWPVPLRDRDPQVLRLAAWRLEAPLQKLRVEQWVFARQWQALRDHAAARGVRLFGDLPIYVAPDSVSVWSNRRQFQLEENGRSRAVAGVPPDYFAADGQLWGNPLYDWAVGRADGFAFWRARVGQQLTRFDLVRIDHFRGLAGYWSVPAGAQTAREGAWVSAPGVQLFETLQRELPDLPFVAEDLGVITPDVDALRQRFHLPGMRVLQFGFDGSGSNPHLPHNFSVDTVAYSGTHDNDTTLGWYAGLDAGAAAQVNDYLRCNAAEMPQALLHATLASVARLAIVPAQDLLALGSAARFNVPGTASGNWQWRLPPQSLGAELAARYAHLNHILGRM
ncbi:MAG: 4-alpha-glucanotransferase [Steroidobacteraceae bacterium]